MTTIKKYKIFIILVGLAALVWVGIANPFNWFVRRSERFSFRAFEAIKTGTRIENAIARLGAPIKKVRSSDDMDCSGCVAYYFLGDPPSWLLCFQEAWMRVDSHGRIVAVIVYSEP